MAAITDLSTASSVNAADYLVLSQSGTDKKVTADKFAVLTSGTFTPGLAFGGNGVGMTFSSRSGTYVKAGKIVVVSFDIRLSAKGSSTGAATITGLPITAGSGLPDAIGHLAWYQMNANFVNILLAVSAGATSGLLVGYSAAAASYASLTEASFANNSILQGTIVYQSA